MISGDDEDNDDDDAFNFIFYLFLYLTAALCIAILVFMGVLCRWCVELCDSDPLLAMTETHLTFSRRPR